MGPWNIIPVNTVILKNQQILYTNIIMYVFSRVSAGIESNDYRKRMCLAKRLIALQTTDKVH